MPDQTPDLKTPRGRYQALLQEINKAAKIHDEASRKAKTSEERSRIYQEKFPHARLYAGRFLAIAESAPNDPAGVDALDPGGDIRRRRARVFARDRPPRRAPRRDPERGARGLGP